ncbi:hypothetical protein D9619_003480 [Psilocybe cf. subviscida]|uniref:TMEM205-like domain-containing protein n=1 Tax=Psilocybe cf. subviscida TaxID=2480587 RepID=A0A8H5EU46_9AGAR|nr:hypothetical protein D9619_003480 [Psilocybe cf. subviscida]
MAKVHTLDLTALVNLNGLYMLGYSFLFGMCVIAYKSLPRHQFGALQHKTFPIYFLVSISLSSALLGTWVFRHPDVLDYLAKPWVADVSQVYALATVWLSQASNYFVVGPMTSKVMFRRQNQEKEEGKNYNDAGVSAEMKALNRQFGSLHGISSLANLFAVIALGFHGLYIGSAGVKGY